MLLLLSTYTWLTAAQWLHKNSNQTGPWKLETDVMLLSTDVFCFLKNLHPCLTFTLPVACESLQLRSMKRTQNNVTFNTILAFCFSLWPFFRFYFVFPRRSHVAKCPNSVCRYTSSLLLFIIVDSGFEHVCSVLNINLSTCQQLDKLHYMVQPCINHAIRDFILTAVKNNWKVLK